MTDIYTTPGYILLKVILDGLSVGSVYALVALGFVIIYKATDVINFAQGELMMCGVYFCYYLMTVYQVPIVLALTLTMFFNGILGILLDRIFLRPLLGEPILSLVMVTIAISLLLKSVAGLVFGHETFSFPQFVGDQPVFIFKVPLMPINLLTVGFVTLLMIVLFIFFRRSKLGLAMMATAENQVTAKIMGINVKRIFGISWAIGAIIAAIGGIFYSLSNYVNPSIGMVGMKAFPAAVLGGLDSIAGSLCGGLIIGLLESATAIYLEPVLIAGIKEVVAFILLILILMVRPYGLFGTKEIERV